jgi:hypothetical protein
MLSASMMMAGTEVRVVIRDISATGALITTPVMPPEASYVTLRRSEVCIGAQVVWSRNGKAGLHFHERVDEASLLVVIGRPAKASASRTQP